MALFGRKKEIVPLPPIAQWEYRCGDGHHWGFHYRVAEEQDHVRLTYSRTMPEHLESIAAPAVLWQQLSELGDRYHITAWAGYNECRLRTPPYQALAFIYHLRRWYQPAGGGLRRRPKRTRTVGK